MKMPPKKYILFAVLIVVVIVISVFAAILFSQYQTSIKPLGDKKTPTTAKKAVVEEKSDDAMKQAYEGDVAGGAAKLDEAINNTDDKNEKYVYYSRKATLLYNGQDLAGALAAALKAYGYVQSSDSAALVAQFSNESGNKPQAVEYYKKAVQNIDRSDPYWNEDVSYYNSMIKELGGN